MGGVEREGLASGVCEGIEMEFGMARWLLGRSLEEYEYKSIITAKF